MSSQVSSTIKSKTEIGNLAAQLRPVDQSYVLNTINALLFSMQSNNADTPNPQPDRE